MRILRSCSDRFFTSLALCLASSAAWLVYLSAIISFPARVAADTIVLPDPLYTNQFTTVESWVQLDTVRSLVLTPEEVTNFCFRVDQQCSAIDSRAVQFFWDVYYFVDYVSHIPYDIEDFPWPDDAFTDEVIEAYESWSEGVTMNARGYQSSAYALIQDITNETAQVSSIVNELRTHPLTNVITSVSFGSEYGYTDTSGGCHCPDYTDYLEGIAYFVGDLQGQFQESVYNVALAAIDEFGSASGLGASIGQKYAFLKLLLDGILGNLSFVDENAEDFGQRLAELGYTLSLVQRGDEENLRYYNVASNLYAHLIDGWCFPTNIEERPLWVTFDQDALRGLLDDVLDNARIKVSVTNALKVSVTNDIHVVTDVSQEITQIENNMLEIEDMAGNLHVDEVAEITDTIDDRTHLFDGWDARIRQFPERFESLWNTQYELPPDIVIYDGYSAVVRSGGFNGWGSASRRSRSGGDEEILAVDTLRLEIGPDADTASGRWIYRIATACHTVTNVVWSLLFLAILVKLFKIDIFLLRSSCFIFLAWLSALGVGGMRRLSIMEAMAESFDRIAKLFTSMFGDGGEDAA